MNFLAVLSLSMAVHQIVITAPVEMMVQVESLGEIQQVYFQELSEGQKRYWNNLKSYLEGGHYD